MVPGSAMALLSIVDFSMILSWAIIEFHKMTIKKLKNKSKSMLRTSSLTKEYYLPKNRHYKCSDTTHLKNN